MLHPPRAILLLSLALILCAEPARAERTRYFELQPQFGYSWVNLTGFSQEKFVDDVTAAEGLVEDAGQVPVEGSGPSAGVGAQLKLWVFVLGSRYNYTQTSDFGLHTVGADVGMRIGDVVALYGRAGLGFAFLSSLPQELTTDGFLVPVSGGVDVKLSEALSLGVGLDAEVLLLTQAQKVGDALASDLQAQEIDRDTLGFQIRPQLHLTWHP